MRAVADALELSRSSLSEQLDVNKAKRSARYSKADYTLIRKAIKQDRYFANFAPMLCAR